MAVRGWGREKRGLLFNEYGVSAGEDEKSWKQMVVMVANNVNTFTAIEPTVHSKIVKMVNFTLVYNF